TGCERRAGLPRARPSPTGQDSVERANKYDTKTNIKGGRKMSSEEKVLVSYNIEVTLRFKGESEVGCEVVDQLDEIRSAWPWQAPYVLDALGLDLEDGEEVDIDV